MNRPPRSPSSERRSRRLLAIAAACAVVTVVAAGVSVWALAAQTQESASVAVQPAAGGSADVPAGGSGEIRRLERTLGEPRTSAALSFGHTIDRTVPSPSARMDASMRLPFELGVRADAFRVHVRNWQFNSEEIFPS